MPPGAKPWPDPARGPGGDAIGYQLHIWLPSDSTLYAETRSRFNRCLKWLRVCAPGSVRHEPEPASKGDLWLGELQAPHRSLACCWSDVLCVIGADVGDLASD